MAEVGLEELVNFQIMWAKQKINSTTYLATLYFYKSAFSGYNFIKNFCPTIESVSLHLVS